ncbi:MULTISPECIES: hypothetical protein [Lysobacter]|uniref:hypothetical protein n=1 Tax=Lysobacter TaxID=68 RepID=UPI001F3566C2|nr:MULTISPECIES: hypothetical protein [Lysobacter]UJB18809.1 hypothetical protein L1A79_21220 [Lysobacter capsici]UJQ27466.1 hypothetical protein L2D09_18665 [Lysobacter gummosus]
MAAVLRRSTDGSVACINAICLELPEAYEDLAWTGTRWMVAKKELCPCGDDRQRVAAGLRRSGRHCGLDGRADVSTTDCAFGGAKVFEAAVFQAGVISEHRRGGNRYGSDWEEIADLLTERYRVLAPKKLAVLLDQFGD